MASTKSPSRNIEWKIRNVTKELLTEGKRLSSGVFEVPFDDKMTKWYLRAYIEDSKFLVYLFMQEPKLTRFLLKYEFHVQTLSFEKDRSHNSVKDCSIFNDYGHAYNPFNSITELFENSDKYLDNGTMTIGIKVELVKSEEPDNRASNNSQTINCVFRAMLKEYFYSKLNSDFTFVCSDSIEIQAHRPVLVFASHVLKEIIDLETCRSIKVDDIDSEEMNEILRYIYTKEVDDIDKFAPKLIFGAEKYEINDLKDLCVRTMIDNLSVENAVDYFLLADQYSMKDLLNCCFKFIKTNHKVLVQNKQEWDKLDKKHLNVLLDYYQENARDIMVFESSF